MCGLVPLIRGQMKHFVCTTISMTKSMTTKWSTGYGQIPSFCAIKKNWTLPLMICYDSLEQLKIWFTYIKTLYNASNTPNTPPLTSCPIPVSQPVTSTTLPPGSPNTRHIRPRTTQESRPAIGTVSVFNVLISDPTKYL